MSDDLNPSTKDSKTSSADEPIKKLNTGDVELTAEELESVSGGRTPGPGGPIPVPYPNNLIDR